MEKERLLKGLLNLNPRNFDNTILSQVDMLQWFRLCDAVWLHDDNPEKPHTELTSGNCSNGFFDCLRVLCYPPVNEILAHQLVYRLNEAGATSIGVDWVIGSAYAAITISYEVAKILGAVHMFVEKDPMDPKGKRMLWKRLTIPEGAQVLQIEELITTSGTMQEVRRAVEEGNETAVNFIPQVGTLVHRPPKLPVNYGNQEVIPVIEKEVWSVSQDKCPLCAAGSKRLRPKTNWAELTGKT